MNNIVCIKHPTYAGDQAPVLSCKTCCAKYIAAIKLQQTSKQLETQSETQEKTLAKAAQESFFPGSI